MIRLFSLIATIALSTLAATAQPLRLYIGPTVGVTTPGLRSQKDEGGANALDYYNEKRTPIVSPLLGISAGFNILNRLGVDAGVHYSYTGYRYSYDLTNDSLSSHYDEKMTLHKVSVPLTVGYAFGISRARIRVGAGIAYTYYFAGKFTSEESTTRSGQVVQIVEQGVDLFSNGDGYSLAYPRQIHPRMSLTVAPIKKLIITLAGTLGYDVTLPKNGASADLNRSDFAAHALDFTVTYSLR